MNHRILVVEDSPTQAERLRALLIREGYAVELARTGTEGLTIARPDRVDLVISDVTMPELDGFEFCTAMKSSEVTKRIPIILLTGRASPGDIIKGLESGADNFIPKPYQDDQLLERVRRIFEQLEHRKSGRLEMEVNLTLGDKMINVTADRQQIMELLLSTFEELSTNYDALAQANRELAEARVEADRANQAKSEFLSRMSHELRTPLNAILGFGQLLEMHGLEPEQQESVRYIVHGGRHLLDLIDEILDLSRIESGTLTISPEPVMLADALTDVLALVQPLAAERQVELVSDLGALGQRYVRADRQRLKQVLLNLLSNAIKYNRRGGRACVILEEQPTDRMRILVRDEGAGIPHDKLERLFAPFDRLGAEASDVEGTGLGLALTKRLVEVMGGTLSLESTVDEGSTFAVELPAVAPPDEAPLRQASDVRRQMFDATLPPSTILYVEDNLSNLRLAEQLFADLPQLTLIPAMQGSIALELARQHQANLILLDLHLPDMNGTEVLERLKADPATRSVPVVVLSADATDRQIARVLDKGASHYLTKPLDLQRFVDVVATILRGNGDR
jgi:signal transduction histidine kinase